MVRDLNIDTMGIAKTNTNWYQIPEEQGLKERVSAWWEGKKITTAHTSNDEIAQQHQWGRVTLMSILPIAHQAFEIGRDSSNLGC